MSQQILLKNGQSANLGTLTLAAGEAAFAKDTGKLYIGNGTGKVLINPDQSTNALTADKLSTARTITIGGDVGGSTSFDGSANVTITTTVNAVDLSKVTGAGTAASKNVGVAAGNVPVLDAGGKLDVGVLPAIAINDTFVVADQAAMLALTAQTGDIAVRNDLSKSFILKANDATVLSNWVELKTPADAVSSVNGKTGAVVLSAADVGLGNVTNESKATMFNNAALTGNSTAVTQAHGDNSTKIATTAFVQDAISVIDGGTF
jgi:hypothetical protein